MAERTDRAWPIALAMMLLFMVGTSLAFFAVATTHPDAEVVEDAYAAGLRYNEERRLDRRADELGLEIRLDTEPSEHGMHVTVSVLDAQGSPVRADRVRVQRVRPTLGGFDGETPLVASGDAFAGEIALPLRGRWRLVATVEIRGEELRRTVNVWRG